MENIKQLAEMLLDLERRVALLEAQRGGNFTRFKPAGSKATSIKEFISVRKPSGDVQKTLLIAYYLEKYDGITPFSVGDLSKGFQLARESVPQNINDKINMNIGKGHLMEAKTKKDNKKAWLVTNSGEQFVENGLKRK